MAEVKLKIRQSAAPEDLGKGEGIIFTRRDPLRSYAMESEGLVFGCPRCAHVSTGEHKYDRATKTLTPSIICGKCGYHGKLINGIFNKVKQ
jgi:transcription elongation factor Elf1